MSGWRTGGGRAIDRTRRVRFTFDGKPYQGFAGDTLASALLANGVDVVARSFKYHRPRGIVAFGADEPNALVQIGEDAKAEPNSKATQIELTDGMAVASQNRWPSLGFDIGAINDLLAPLLPAGFYYKTFKWPAKAWPLYEKWIRKAAGMGRVPRGADPDVYETRYTHTDILIIGGGIAGLAAAERAAANGLGVVLIDDGADFGGVPAAEPVEGREHGEWVGMIVARLAAAANVTLLPRTTAAGHYDGQLVMAVERRTGAGARERRHMIVADRIILATGCMERPLPFENNDRPGIMVAQAAHRYLIGHGVAAGRRALLYANHDRAYDAIFALQDAGVEIAAVVDQRPRLPEALETRLGARGIRSFCGHRVLKAVGKRRVTRVTVAPLNGQGKRSAQTIGCDLVLVSGGYTPVTQIFTHAGGTLQWDSDRDAFLPDPESGPLQAVGSCAGEWHVDGCLEMGRAAAENWRLPPARAIAAMAKPILATGGRTFIDLQNDVTSAGIRLAAREGYRRIEHAKRYTTLGMGTDQGRLAGLNGVSILAEAQGLETAAIGNSRPRPPFGPVTFGVMAGPFVGKMMMPTRTTPMDEWHRSHGAVMGNVGIWRRPQLYLREGESELEAVIRETRSVRSRVGMTDVSTLGKIDLKGPDVGKLLDFVYINGFARLKPGACRYGIMLREDGMVFDDGTVTRLSDDHWFMTTTTGNAEQVLAHLEHVRQIDLPDLDVTITLVSDQWGAMAIAGPEARHLLAALVPDFDCSNDGLPFMRMAQGRLAGIPARILRVSFSGELAYEIYVPASRTPDMWRAILTAGEPMDLCVYGTEAMMALRIEKGLFVPGFEADGRTTPDDLGVGQMVSQSKDFVGRCSLGREAFRQPDRRQLVGIMTLDPAAEIPRGSQIVHKAPGDGITPMLGPVTSIAYSVALERWIGLALVAGGRSMIGRHCIAAAPLAGQIVPVQICDPIFVDPDRSRLRG